MRKRFQTTRHRLSIFLPTLLIGSLHFAPCQSAPSVSLDEILRRLEDNLNHYYKDVPNFYCSEHVVSSLSYAKTHQVTATDSSFRVMRESAGTLTESHEVQAINGTPAGGVRVGGPTSVSGVFTGSLNAVSLSQSACMRYTLQPADLRHPNQPYVIQFVTSPNTQHVQGCLLKEEAAGRVFVDPATFQVTRLELKAPNHRINSAEVGTWRIAIDYEPVSLAGKIFWMPSAVTSTAIPDGFTPPEVYSFSAKYSDYHKLEVTSHIVPSQ
jgi:hypothetical protein